MKHLAEMEEWLRIFAVQHSVGNWDSFGNRNAQNMYGYKPTQGKWTLMSWDFNIVLGNSGSDGPAGDDLFQYNTADAAMLRIYQTPEFRRMYLRAFKDIVDGPMSGPAVASLVDASPRDGWVLCGVPAAVQHWFASRSVPAIVRKPGDSPEPSLKARRLCFSCHHAGARSQPQFLLSVPGGTP